MIQVTSKNLRSIYASLTSSPVVLSHGGFVWWAMKKGKQILVSNSVPLEKWGSNQTRLRRNLEKNAL